MLSVITAVITHPATMEAAFSFHFVATAIVIMRVVTIVRHIDHEITMAGTKSDTADMCPRVVLPVHIGMAYTMELIIVRKKDYIREAIMDINKSNPTPAGCL